jgi:hypothetical protein
LLYTGVDAPPPGYVVPARSDDMTVDFIPDNRTADFTLGVQGFADRVADFFADYGTKLSNVVGEIEDTTLLLAWATMTSHKQIKSKADVIQVLEKNTVKSTQRGVLRAVEIIGRLSRITWDATNEPGFFRDAGVLGEGDRITKQLELVHYCQERSTNFDSLMGLLDSVEF